MSFNPIKDKLPPNLFLRNKFLRNKFPFFSSQNSDGLNMAYLDSAATAQKPEEVINFITDFYSNKNASVHRGIYELAENVSNEFESVRGKVAKFINTKFSEEIIFNSGTTAGINFIADAWGRNEIGPGDNILITQAEHHSNLLPWQRLAKRTGATLSFIPINNKTFLLDFDESLITKNTKLVAITHSSNVLDYVWKEGDLERLIKKAHSVGAKVLLDGAQSVAHQKVDLQKLDVDFFVFSSHKIAGPTGAGVLFIKKELHNQVEPYQVGGGMVQSVSISGDSVWLKAPNKFEAGTPPIAQVIGLGKAIDFFESNINFDDLKNHEAKLCSELIDFLSNQDGVKILGNKETLSEKGHVVSCELSDVHAHDMAAKLGESGVAVRAGNHCAQPLHDALGVGASLRISFFCYNTMDDVIKFKDAFLQAKKFFLGESL
jgi:cysteine desulfurase / selenocysteine lyase